MIDLEKCTLILPELSQTVSGVANSMGICDGERCFLFSAETLKDLRTWMQFLRSIVSEARWLDTNLVTKLERKTIDDFSVISMHHNRLGKGQPPPPPAQEYVHGKVPAAGTCAYPPSGQPSRPLSDASSSRVSEDADTLRRPTRMHRHARLKYCLQ